MGAEALHINQADFENKVLQSDLPVLVDFWAEWCRPCKQLGPVIDSLAADYADSARVCKVNADENPELLQQLAVRSLPTTLLFADGELKGKVVGLRPRKEFAALLDQVCQAPAGASVAAPDSADEAPMDIFAAVETRDPDAVRQVLEKQPDALEQVNQDGFTPVGIAVRGMYMATANMLAEEYEPKLDAIELAALNKAEALGALIAENPDVVHAADEASGFSVLDAAAMWGSLDAVKLLLDAGANANRVGKGPIAQSPLQLSLRSCNPDVVKLLLERGARLDSGMDYPILGLAAMTGSRELCDLLISKGANPMAVHERGGVTETPADVAKKFEHIELAAWLQSLMDGGAT